MHEAMAIYAKRASTRLVKDSQQAKLMTCFAETSHFNQTAASFPPVTVKLPVPAADPVPLTKAATGALEGRIVDGVPYARAGVMLTDLSPAGAAPQLPMFATAHEEKHIGSLLRDVLDRFGSGPIGLGVAEPDWSRKCKALSPRFSTEWAELAVVKPAHLPGVAVQPKSCFGQDSPFRAEVRRAQANRGDPVTGRRPQLADRF
jgi:DNA polymerase V